MKKVRFMLFVLFLMLPFTVDAMLIKIKPADQEVFEIEVEDSDTVEFLKVDIENEKGIKAAAQKLVFGNKILEDGRTLADYGIEKGSIVNLFYKTEITGMELFLENPKVGDRPSDLIDVILCNKDKSLNITINNLNIEWYEIVRGQNGSDDENVFLDNDDVFESGKEYFFEFSLNSSQKIIDELAEKDAYTSTSTAEMYLNSKKFNYGDSFYIGGVRKIDTIVDTMLIGQSFPTTVKVVLTTDTETKEFVVSVSEWRELIGSIDQKVDDNAVVEKYKKYFPVFTINDDELGMYMSTMDFRTEHYLNGDSKKYYETDDIYKVIFDANSGKFKDSDKYIINEWKNELYDTLVVPTKEGYRFVGYFTEKTGGTKFESILAESGVDGDMTFYAQWVKDVDNPNTSDNVKAVIVSAVVSLIGILVSMINLVKERRKELL